MGTSGENLLWGENFCFLLWNGKRLNVSSPALSQSASVLVTDLVLLNPWSSRCSKELNQWEALTEYGQSKGHINPYLVLECAWRVSNWTAMKEALVQVRPLSCCLITRWAQIMFSTAAWVPSTKPSVSRVFSSLRTNWASWQMKNSTWEAGIIFGRL